MPPPSVGCLDTFRGLFGPSAHTLSSASSSSSSASSAHLNRTSNSAHASSIHAPLAIIDMGSNGIRFGIIAALDRHLPVLYEERAPISLFDAQYSSDPSLNADDVATATGKQLAAVSSISNSATIAVLARQDDDDEDSTGDANDHFDEEDSLEEDYHYSGDDNDSKAALRRTLVNTDDNEITVFGPGPVKDRSSGPSERRPISEKIIREVVKTFERWQALCHQARVQTVRVIATEATRTAPNSEEFQERIKAATGWTVELLSKAQESNIGALGVMASYHTVQGLFMDLGGGSVQLNYIIRGPTDGQGKSSQHAQSWPYGAAALSKRLNSCGHDQGARDVIYSEMVQAFKHGLEDIDVAPAIRERNEQEHGYRMYLSGGGFRALGYLLMAKKMNKGAGGDRYPIPIINGYMASAEELAKVVEEYRHLSPDEVKTCFRVSKRRAKLIPACATLMAAVMEVIPIKEVLFSEGGVRQGGCFSMLPPHIQNRDPALETVYSFVRSDGGGQPALHESDLEALSTFVASALPSDFANCCRIPISSTSSAALNRTSTNCGSNEYTNSAELQVFIESLPRLIPILVCVMNCYNQMAKEARSTAAWQLFLPGGALANCFGLSHSDRAILATVLAERHEGGLADPDTGDTIKKLIPGGKVARQAAKYLGKILALAGLCSPLPGMATQLLGSGSGLGKHGGRVRFGQSLPSIENGNHKKRRDHDRTRVGDDPSSSSDSSGDECNDDIVVLRSGLNPEGISTHGQVVVRIEKGHPLLDAPNIQEAIKSLAKAAAKAHGFHASHPVDEQASNSGKGKSKGKSKGVQYTK